MSTCLGPSLAHMHCLGVLRQPPHEVLHVQWGPPRSLDPHVDFPLAKLGKGKVHEGFERQWRPFTGLEASCELASLPIWQRHLFKEASKGGEGFHLP
ncbi:hypothetical protein KY290_024979 [Solanum tuberosum]|uniref:Uncharacterized protein n=1 Tax=Solanum tuberosum TaxID=4113 RepID=A0ABQ7US76_SOLTU|nr:hypothetical protein KY290_024979 [Solanum tuberosum]